MSEAQTQQPPAEKQPFVPTEAQRKPHGAFVTKVYANQIGGFCTPETEKLLAKKHLAKTGVLLRYSWEVDTPRQQRAHEWEERLLAYLEANPNSVKGGVRMPKENARRELIRLERIHSRRAKAKTPDEKKRAAEDFRYMNELRSLLGMGEHDYEKNGVPVIAQEVHAEFDSIQAITEPDARLAAVRVLKHPDLLRLLMLNDSHSAVRELAEKRYGEVLAGAGRR